MVVIFQLLVQCLGDGQHSLCRVCIDVPAHQVALVLHLRLLLVIV